MSFYHVHGVIRPFYWVSLDLTFFLHDAYFTARETQMHVSRGPALVIPVRIFNRPDVSLVIVQDAAPDPKIIVQLNCQVLR